MAYQGSRDIDAAVSALAGRLPGPLAPLARVAYNYRWSWLPDGPATFATVDPDRWARLGGNPVRLLTDAPAAVLDWAATDPDLVARGVRLAAAIDDDAGRTPRAGPVTPENPVAFLYAEFGVHASLPIYSGGLGVLAGDILKAASDLALPLVGVGLLYRTGYFHQRIDTTGLQHEYWVDTDPTLLPCVRVTDRDGQPLTATSQCTTRTSLCRCGGSTWGGYRSTCSTPISPRTRSWPAGSPHGCTRATGRSGWPSTQCWASAGPERSRRWASARPCTTSTRDIRRWRRSSCSRRPSQTGRAGRTRGP